MVWGQNRVRDVEVPVQIFHCKCRMLPRTPVAYKLQCSQQHGTADAVVNQLAVSLGHLPSLCGLGPVVFLNAPQQKLPHGSCRP